METFIVWISAIGALCIGIMILATFFKIINAIGTRFPRVQTVRIKGFLTDTKLVDVHLTSGKIIKSVQFKGFTDYANAKSKIPYQLASMAVFETEDNRRILIRSDSIRVIEEIIKQTNPEDQPKGSSDLA